jgi:hypothetical protein
VTPHATNACFAESISLNHGPKVRVSVPFFAANERFSLVIYYQGAFGASCVHCSMKGVMGGVEHTPRGFLAG